MFPIAIWILLADEQWYHLFRTNRLFIHWLALKGFDPMLPRLGRQAAIEEESLQSFVPQSSTNESCTSGYTRTGEATLTIEREAMIR